MFRKTKIDLDGDGVMIEEIKQIQHQNTKIKKIKCSMGFV